MATYCSTPERNMQYGDDPYCFTPSMCVCIFVYVCMCVCMCVCIIVYMCMCVYVCVYVCMSVCLCVCVCMYNRKNSLLDISRENCFALNCFSYLG